MGTHGEEPIMMPVGDFHITNRSDGKALIARSMLAVRYKRWGFFPATRHVDGWCDTRLSEHSVHKDHLFWEIDPPVLREGDTLIAKVGLVDHLGKKFAAVVIVAVPVAQQVA